MEKYAVLQRYILIISKLERRGTFFPTKELKREVEKDMNLRYGYSGYSLRSLQRDIQGISELFGIVITNRKDKGYHIAEKFKTECVDRYEELLMSFDILAALNAESGLCQYVLAEHHRPTGSANLPVLLNAIRENRMVEFSYTFVRQNDKIARKKVAPYFLKESNQRWYLLAFDSGNTLKTFAIDRISDLVVFDLERFDRDQQIDAEKLFRDCYGIWDQADIPVEDIILSYDALDGKFIKTLPIHHSQRILTDTAEEFRIGLRLRVTNDFVMELLSRSRSLTVIQPAGLRERIREVYRSALARHLEESSS